MLPARVPMLWGLAVAVIGTLYGVQGDPLDLAWVPEYPSYYIGEEECSVVVTVKAPESVVVGRAPVSLTAVLDASGSMAGPKIEVLKRTAEYLVETLDSGDYLGVVTYNDFVYENIPLIPVDKSVKPSIRAGLRAILAGGATNLSGGLFEGIKQQSQTDLPFSKYVILFTDGLANGGIEDINEIEFLMDRALAAPDSPIVYTLGFGIDQDPNFLYRIAHAGQGSYVYINNAADIGATFGQILGGLLSVQAHDIVATLTPLNGASITRVKAGGRIFPGEDSWQVLFADLFAAEVRDILIDMRIPLLSRPRNRQKILRIDVTYFDPFSGIPVTAAPIIVVIQRTVSIRPIFITPAPVVEVTKVRFQVAEDIEAAVQKKMEGDYAGAKNILDILLGLITASSEYNNPEVQQLAGDVGVVRDTLQTKQPLTPDVEAALTAAAIAIEDQRTAGSTPLKSTQLYTTPKKTEEAQKAHDFVKPVVPEEITTSEAFGVATTSDGIANSTNTAETAVTDDESIATAESNSVAEGDDASATSEANTVAVGGGDDSERDADAVSIAGSTATGSGADADSTATANAIGGSGGGDADADAEAESVATGSDASATSTGEATAVGGFEGGDADAFGSAVSEATGSDAGAVATGGADATGGFFGGDATAESIGQAFTTAPTGDATAEATADSQATGGFLEGSADADATAEAEAQGDTAEAQATSQAEAVAPSVGDADATATSTADAVGSDALALADSFGTAIGGQEGGDATAEGSSTATSTGAGAQSTATGNSEAVSVEDATSTSTGTAEAVGSGADAFGKAGSLAESTGADGSAEATSTGQGTAVGPDSTATGEADSTAIVGEEEATAFGSGDVTIDGNSVSTESEASATGETATASASSVATSGGPGGPSGSGRGEAEATAADGAAKANATGIAEASAPAPAPEAVQPDAALAAAAGAAGTPL